MSELYVRLKPFDPKRENAIQVYVCGHVRFEESKWISVSAELAADLRRVHQNYYDERSPLAFDVCTLAQAVALGFKPEHASTPAIDESAGASGSSSTPPSDAAGAGNRTRKKDA